MSHGITALVPLVKKLASPVVQSSYCLHPPPQHELGTIWSCSGVRYLELYYDYGPLHIYGVAHI